jgi:DnaK suppressor protein
MVVIERSEGSVAKVSMKKQPAGKAKPPVGKPVAAAAKPAPARSAAKGSARVAPVKSSKVQPVIQQKKSAAPSLAVVSVRPSTPGAGKSSLTPSSLRSKHRLVESKPARKSDRMFSSSSHKGNNHAPPPLPPAPVMSDGKPRKNQAGLSSRELEFYRELLLAKRRELVGDMSSMEREALRSAQGSNLSNLPIHMADMGTDNYEQEFTLGLVEKDRQLLREINIALAKIQNGTYGICEGTGKPIRKERLEAQPWAKYSIEYARELEKRGIRR